MPSKFSEKFKNYDIRDGRGRTPLMRAVIEGQSEEALTLLRKGANPHLKDNNGKSVLCFAGQAEPLNLTIIKHLRDFGAGLMQDREAMGLVKYRSNVSENDKKTIKDMVEDFGLAFFKSAYDQNHFKRNREPLQREYVEKRVANIHTGQDVEGIFWFDKNYTHSVVFKCAFQDRFEELADFMHDGEYFPPEKLLAEDTALGMSVVQVLFYTDQLPKLFDRAFWPPEARSRFDGLFNLLPENYQHACVDAYQTACSEWGRTIPSQRNTASSDFSTVTQTQNTTQANAQDNRQLHERLKPRPRKVKFRNQR